LCSVAVKLLHRDADNALNCLLNGTKDWILIDPKHEDMLPIAVESGWYFYISLHSAISLLFLKGIVVHCEISYLLLSYKQVLLMVVLL